MKNLKGLAIIFFCLLVGESLRVLIDFPIPPVIYGMLVLFVLLLLKAVKVKDVEDVGDVLLNNLAFLFVPATASLIDRLDLLADNILPILLICLISLPLTMGVSFKVVEGLQKVRKKNE